MTDRDRSQGASDRVERERAMLEDLAEPFVRDVVRTLDRDFTLSFEIHDSLWQCMSHERGGRVSGRGICEVGEVEDYVGSDSARALCDIASKVTEFAFDDVLEPWPRCPDHGGHPLHPDLRDGQAVWSAEIRVAVQKARIGEVAG